MKVRVFISPWSFITTSSGLHDVTCPMLEHLRDADIKIEKVYWVWPENDKAITNTCNLKNPNVMMFVKMQNSFNFNAISALENVKTLPAYRPDTPIGNIPQIAKDNMQADLSALGLSFAFGQDWNETLKNVAQQIRPTALTESNINSALNDLDFD